MNDFEVISTHLGLQKIRLCYHTINIDVHDGLGKLLIAKLSSLGVFVEQCLKFVLFKVAPELV